MTEKSLSDKVRQTVVGDRYTDYDVKYFIKKIMEELREIDDEFNGLSLGNVAFVLDKLAGPKLIEDEK